MVAIRRPVIIYATNMRLQPPLLFLTNLLITGNKMVPIVIVNVNIILPVFAHINGSKRLIVSEANFINDLGMITNTDSRVILNVIFGQYQ